MVELHDVLAPSYTELSRAKRSALQKQSEHNISRIITGDGAGWYTNAARLWNTWIQERVVERDEQPAIYVLHQIEKSDGKTVTHKGCIALCELESPDQRSIIPIYDTHIQQREDRVRLLEATHTHFNPVSMCYNNAHDALDSVLTLSTHSDPLVECTFDGIVHQLWRVTNRAAIEHAIHFFKHEKLFITSGQHRYEAALRYRETQKTPHDEHRSEYSSNYVPAFLYSISEPGTTLQPIHRAVTSTIRISREDVLAKLHKNFTLNQFSREEGLRHLRDAGPFTYLFTFPQIGTYTLVHLKNSEILPTLLPIDGEAIPFQFDLTLLHDYIFQEIFTITKEDQLYADRIFYSKEEHEIFSFVQKNAAIGIFLKAPTLLHIRDAAQNGIKLPYNAVRFYPQLPSGLVMYSLTEE